MARPPVRCPRLLVLGAGLVLLIARGLLAPPVLAAQTLCEEDPTMCVAPTVTVSPPSGSAYAASTATHAVQVTVRWCANSPLVASSRQIRANGILVTSQFTYASGAAGCAGAGATSVGTVQLRPGSNTVTGTIANADGIEGAGTAVYAYAQQSGPPGAVSVVADAPSRRVADSLPSAAAFTVSNDGTQPAAYTVAAACTGVGVTGCAPSRTSVSLPAGESAAVGVTFRAGTAGSTATVRLTAWRSDAVSVRDSAGVAVTVVDEPPAGEPGDVDVQAVVARGLCVTAGAGEGAAYECGDLRLAHALPATRVLNRAFAPTLLHLSQHARPFPVVAITVSPPVGTAPDSVIASLTVNAGPGGTTVARGAWPGWAGGDARRIALGFDASAYATGVYDVTLTVQTKKAGVVAPLTSRAGRTVIVNRAASPFGRGWWVAGVEQLLPRGDGSVLWIGGDGSVRLYAPAGQAGRWAAPALTRPDTLKADASPENPGGWVRELQGGGRVVFDAQGRHVRTANALGHRSEFEWSGGRLARILLPRGDLFSTGYAYAFEYDAAGRLARVVAPYADAVGDRVTKVSVDGAGQLTAVTDPDSTIVGFGYDAAFPGLVRRRVDRMGVPVDFTFDPYLRLARVEVDRDSTPGIATAFTAAETLGRPGIVAVPAAAVATSIDGPLPGADVTRFRLDRFGAPLRVTDALGQTTTVTRGDERFPALATHVRGPTGAERSAAYDARGRLVASTDWSRPAGVATTLYEWDDAWDAVTRTTSPTGIVTRTAYDPATGQRTWQQVGQDSARRVHFTYRPSNDPRAPGLVETVRSAAASARGEAPQRVEYDERGNLARVISPLGVRDSTAADRIGRDTASASTGAPRTRTWYDLAGRPRASVTTAGSGVSAQRVTVARTYDRSGRALSVTRTMDPDSNRIGEMRTTNVHDRVGRLVRVLDPAGVAETFEHDAAGNVTARTSRRGHRTTTDHDLLGRPTRRITPAVSHASLHPVYAWGRTWTFPRHPLDPDLGAADPTRIRGDTAVFTYHALGGILTADNRDARVTRTYNADGSLASERQRVRTYTGLDHAAHDYLVRYGYDLEGRRRVVRHPAQLAPAGQDSTVYRFDEVGQLAEVVDPMGNLFRYRWDMDGRLARVDQPGRVSEHARYDADGRRDSAWVRVDTLVGTPGGFATADVFANGLVYDARDKLREVSGDFGGEGEYDGMGALSRWLSRGETGGGTTTNLIDPLGNPVWEDARGWSEGGGTESGYHTRTRWEYTSRTGRQLARAVSDAATGALQTMERSWFDAAGNRVEWSHQSVAGSQRTMFEHARAYYDAEERLRAVDRQRCATQVTPQGPVCGVWNYAANPEKGAFEEYRYDALGRRVLVRRRFAVVNGTVMSESCTGCFHSIDRVVWDGEQILWEVRAPGSAPEIDAAEGEPYGQVGYTHALGMDQPVSILRRGWPHQPAMTIVPHANYRGVLTTGHFPTGRQVEGAVDLRQMPWAGANHTATMAKAYPSQPVAWVGSLVENLADASGQLYRRNRYYDPQSGRFTQEDPIGLAGGLNLYAFGGGDPVGYIDPFGLSADSVKYKDSEIKGYVDALRAADADFDAGMTALENDTNYMYVFEAGPLSGTPGMVWRPTRAANRLVPNDVETGLPIVSVMFDWAEIGPLNEMLERDGLTGGPVTREMVVGHEIYVHAVPFSLSQGAVPCLDTPHASADTCGRRRHNALGQRLGWPERNGW